MGSKARLEILHQDSALIVVNKPAGLLSVPDRFDGKIENVKHLLANQFDEIYTVHRIDRDTSGVLCFARTKEAHRSLSMQFSEHAPQKEYKALVEGVVIAEQGQIEEDLQEDPRRPGRMMIAPKSGFSAYTEYQLEERFADFSWLTVRIKTGRTHQIRVHLQHIGHALVADPLYGRRKALLLSSIKGRKYRLGKEQEERPLLGRTALHAASLGFTHPISGEPVFFTAEPPKDMRATLQQLRKWNAAR